MPEKVEFVRNWESGDQGVETRGVVFQDLPGDGALAASRTADDDDALGKRFRIFLWGCHPGPHERGGRPISKRVGNQGCYGKCL